MIHYHGLPITPATAAARAITGGHAFVSFRRPDQLGLVLEVASSFAVDNGAFSAWRSGEPITDWSPFYEWVAELHRYPSFDFAVIPDVIDGNEDDNDKLIDEWPWKDSAPHIGSPVWHLHESMARLERLALKWPRVCLGSSGEFAQVGTVSWENRMREAMDVVCDKHGRPICKLHGLRMLNPEVFTRFPFASADSTNIGQNVGIDSNWRGTYQPMTKEARAQIMRERIEFHQSPTFWDRKRHPVQKEQNALFMGDHFEEQAA
jgi:hypothetical protein